jgi:hypothetical protein
MTITLLWRIYSGVLSLWKLEGGNDTIRTIKAARIVGHLLSRGFTSRLANMPEPVPIRDDESGAYNTRALDDLLINPPKRFTDLE